MLFSLSGCACVAHVLRVRSATHARLSRFSTLALRPIISLFQTRSAPRSRLSRLLPFALWQVTSLQAKKAVFKTYNQAQLRLCFFLCQAARVLLTYFVYAPLRMLAFRDFQRLLCARLSLCFKHAPLLVLVFLGFCRLLFGKSPLCKQKKQCSRRTTKHNFGCAFFFVRLRVCCSRTSCTLRYACSPFAIFNACSAPDYLFVSNTLRSSFSSFSAFAVCSLASHLFASKKAVFKTYNKSTAICRAF